MNNMRTKLFSGNEKTLRNPVFLIALSFFTLYLLVGAVLRVVFMLSTPTPTTFTALDVVRSLGVGLLSDAGMGVLLTLPLGIIYLGLNEVKYGRRTGLAIVVLLAAALAYTWWPQSIFREYGGGAPLVARIFFGWKLASFGLRYIFPGLRAAWRKVSLYATWGVCVFLALCVAVGEFFFWQEFGVRYNFIAVDYLVYTSEVIGNIMESYAIVPLVCIVVALTVALVLWWSRRNRFKMERIYGLKSLLLQCGGYAVLCGLALALVTYTHGLESRNAYVTQLEQNGACDFLIAFRNNHLEYDKFYRMMPRQECVDLYHELAGLDKDGSKATGTPGASTSRPNIVLITVESLSADFMAHYGNSQQLTPHLDRLVKSSVVLDSLYANGNRTVRGLEALSICIPPNAGESIIKQKNNRMGDMSVGAQLKKQGYHVQFLYGGDSYFDNMGDYFSHNGYEVIDRKTFKKEEITFANIWGVCDGDMFNRSLKIFDADAMKGQPFFAQIMTTSNHRPFTYPPGLIEVEGDPNTREAAVKYTDYAIGKFLEEAAKRPWFKNTVFVVIADHCASSAGKTSLPVEKYHIPCIIYAPGLLKPQAVTTLCSQVDVMPTLLSVLNISCRVKFTGQNIFSPQYRPRAFMATYQDLGYLENNRLTVLSPVRRVAQFEVTYQRDGTAVETPVKQVDNSLVRKAQAYYQFANLYVKRY